MLPAAAGISACRWYIIIKQYRLYFANIDIDGFAFAYLWRRWCLLCLDIDDIYCIGGEAISRHLLRAVEFQEEDKRYFSASLSRWHLRYLYAFQAMHAMPYRPTTYDALVNTEASIFRKSVSILLATRPHTIISITSSYTSFHFQSKKAIAAAFNFVSHTVSPPGHRVISRRLHYFDDDTSLFALHAITIRKPTLS